jgi:pimeloyl-ACP methyl ester carboxylesterase
MPKVKVLGIEIGYDLIGDGDRSACITTGGRFGRDTPGGAELARELAKSGYRTLIWDRPNCGESDVYFNGDNEWTFNADVLAALLRKLSLAPALVYGVSAGSRVSLLTAKRHPDVVRKLAIQWVSGGPFMVGVHIPLYCSNAAFAALAGGMEAVLEDPALQDSIAKNPGNRDRILALEVGSFVATMKRWADALIPLGDSPVPGILTEEFRELHVPTLVFNSSPRDYHHGREYTEQIARLMPNAQLEELPFARPTEFQDRSREGTGLFASLPELAPQLVAFDKR